MPAVPRATLLLLAMLCLAAPGAPAWAGEAVVAGMDDAAEATAPAPAPMPVPADEQARAAVAAVLVATLGEAFGEDMLELKLDEALVDVAGPRDHVVHGVGEVRFAGTGADDWLAFRYQTRYDPVFSSAGYPEIHLGADGEGDGERYVPNDALLLAELEARIAADLEGRPGAGRVFLQLDDVTSLQSGSRFMHIEASGLADFGPGGRTPARVDALYDLHRGAWLGIAHELAPNIQAHDGGGTAVR